MTITKMSELVNLFREAVDEFHPTIYIEGLEFQPSRILEELDSTAFRCGYLNYAESIDIDIDDLEDDLND